MGGLSVTWRIKWSWYIFWGWMSPSGAKKLHRPILLRNNSWGCDSGLNFRPSFYRYRQHPLEMNTGDRSIEYSRLKVNGQGMVAPFHIFLYFLSSEWFLRPETLGKYPKQYSTFQNISHIWTFTYDMPARGDSLGGEMIKNSYACCCLPNIESIALNQIISFSARKPGYAPMGGKSKYDRCNACSA